MVLITPRLDFRLDWWAFWFGLVWLDGVGFCSSGASVISVFIRALVLVQHRSANRTKPSFYIVRFQTRARLFPSHISVGLSNLSSSSARFFPSHVSQCWSDIGVQTSRAKLYSV